MADKPAFTFQSNLKRVNKIIEKAPERVLKVIGGQIVKEVKPTLPSYYNSRSAKGLSSSLNWKFTPASETKDKNHQLQIGFKKFYAGFVFSKKDASGKRGRIDDPITPVVEKNLTVIQDLIGKAIAEMGKAELEDVKK